MENSARSRLPALSRIAGIALVLVLIVAVTVLVVGRSTYRPALTEDGIPLPFGGSTASLAGSITIVRQSPIPVREISFDDGSVSEVLQGSEYVDRIDFVVTPESDTISDGAPLTTAITAGKKYFGYLYTSRDAAAERAAAARLALGDPVTFAELFSGTFFASAEQRAFDNTIANFETQRGIVFLDPSAVTLKKNARYIIVVNDTDTTVTARNLSWCGDAVVSEDGTEECDDGNQTSGDGCSGTDAYPNGSCKIEACGDGYLDTDGLTDANGDHWLVEQCDDGGVCIGGPRNGQSCTTAGLSMELMLAQCGTRDDGGPAPCVSNDNDGCSIRCHAEVCGDGIRQTNEVCDPGGECVIGGAVSTQYSCQPGANDTETRDNIEACVNHGGTCRAVETTACSATCSAPLPPVSLCGNGAIDDGEQCDDGNTTDNDGCSSTCQTEQSPWKNSANALDADGNGQVTLADKDALLSYLNDGATPKTVTTGYTPVPRYPDVDGDWYVTSLDVLQIMNWINGQCGNGQHQPELGEECDDGNTIDDDSCSNACILVANPF